MKEREMEMLNTEGMAVLTGTPKQVAWAEKIRIHMLKPYLNVEKVAKMKPESQKKIHEFLAAIGRIHSARAWIAFAKKGIRLGDLVAEYTNKKRKG